MCGIVGIVGSMYVSELISEALIALQHRGQDSAGISTLDGDRFLVHKERGLVRDVFSPKHMQYLQGISGIGHVRYPTAGVSGIAAAQPFCINSSLGSIALSHNGNLTNTRRVREELLGKGRSCANTASDSEVLLHALAQEIDMLKNSMDKNDIFRVVEKVHQNIHGAYAVVAMIADHGMIAFRDPHGIRPLCLGKKAKKNKTEDEIRI